MRFAFFFFFLRFAFLEDHRGKRFGSRARVERVREVRLVGIV